MSTSNGTASFVKPVSARRSVLLETTLVRKQRVYAWFTVTVPTIATVVAVADAVRTGVSAVALALFFVFYVATLMGITVGFHRLFAHRSFKAGRIVKNALAVMGTMAGQGPVLHWVSNHRRHHNLSDREGDIHSPNLCGVGPWNRIRGLLHAHIGSMFVNEVTNYAVYSPDLMRDPEILWVNNRYLYIVALGIFFPAAIGLGVTGSVRGFVVSLLWGGFVRMFVVHHAIWSITSIAHMFGRKRFQTRDESRNSLWLALVTGGEGWHNTHHAAPGAAVFSTGPAEIDFGGLLVLSMKRLGLVWDVNAHGNVIDKEIRIESITENRR